MGIFDDLSERHERLKKRIHKFKIPLSPRGQVAMKLVYFTIPVVGGLYLMQWANDQARVNLKAAGVLPESEGVRPRSKTEVQERALQTRLGKIKEELSVRVDEAGKGR